MVARSSVEAECKAIAQGICELIWLERHDLKISWDAPMKIYNDSKSAISIVHNPIQHDRMMHVRIDKHFNKTEIEKGTVILSYIQTQDQEADILTKTMSKPCFEVLISKLGMIDIYSPA